MKTALQISGGKDSLACLYFLRDKWDEMCVYWLNTGDSVPYTIEMMNRIKQTVPNFKEIKGRQKEVIEELGWPSDVIPHSHTKLGNMILGKTDFMVQERLNCCINSIMIPMHQAMIEDEIEVVIRGKRNDDADKTGILSGDKSAGYEVIFPIAEWTEKDVYIFLSENNIEIPEYYNYVNDSLDCKSCTAWLNHNSGEYLKEKIPDAYALRNLRLGLIRNAVLNDMQGM